MFKTKNLAFNRKKYNFILFQKVNHKLIIPQFVRSYYKTYIHTRVYYEVHPNLKIKERNYYEMGTKIRGIEKI